jgi:signal transduction histidine kinase
MRSIWLEVACSLATFSLAALGLIWQLCRSRRLELEFRLSEQCRERALCDQESLDTMIQQTQGFILIFEGFAGELQRTDSMRMRMELALDQADSWLNDARKKASNGQPIRPGDDVSLALSRTCRRLFLGGSVRFSTVSTGAPQLLLPHVADEIYRIGVEALTNVLNHAMASCVEVEVAYAGCGLRLCVRDDGCGLTARSLPRDPRRRLIGVQGMRRAAQSMGGQLRIWSRRTAGTEIELVVPAPKAYCHADFVPHWIQTTLFRRWLC